MKRAALKGCISSVCRKTYYVPKRLGQTHRLLGPQPSLPKTAKLARSIQSKFQTQRFLRRLKLDLADEDRAALLDALAGPPPSGGRGASSERGVSFEGDGDGRGKKHAKRGGSGGGKSDSHGSGVRVLYRDFLELMLAEQVLYSKQQQRCLLRLQVCGRYLRDKRPLCSRAWLSEHGCALFYLVAINRTAKTKTIHVIP